MKVIQNKAAIQKQFGNKYKNPEECGKGNYSQVFKCENEQGQFVAIKVLNKKNQTETALKYQLNECELLKKSDNINVIKLLEVQESDSELFFVLEYCQMDLMKMMDEYFNSKIPDDLVIIILKQIMCGLQYLHKNRIIHRDLKLENIGVIIKKDDIKILNSKQENNYVSIFKKATYKILDLGIAKEIVEKTESQVGTLKYIAPEILNNQSYSFQADIYSLGVCLFKMLTGKFPYSGDTPYEQNKLIRSQNTKFNDIQNELFRNIVKDMLQKDVSKRLTFQQLYQSNLIKNSSLIDEPLILNSKLYESDFSLFENQQQSEFIVIQENEQSNQNSNIENNNYNQYLQEKKIAKIKIPTSNQTNNEMQEISVSEYPEQLKKSQIQIPTQKTESCFEIIGLTNIERWEKQKNICILISNLCKKLQKFIQQIPYQYPSFEDEFNSYVQEYSQLAKNLFNQLQAEVNSQSQKYRSFIDSLKDINLINVEVQKQNLFYSLGKIFNVVNYIVQMKDSSTLENLEIIIVKNNQTIFNSITQIFQNIGKNSKEIQCNRYLIWVDLVLITSEFLNLNKKSNDQIVQQSLQDCWNNPDEARNYYYQIVQQYQISFE